MLVYPAGKLNAVHRHLHIEDDEVKRLTRCLKDLHGLAQIRCLENAIPLAVQQAKHEPPNDFLVVNHQDLSWAESSHKPTL
jgi:hypothetical protein